MDFWGNPLPEDTRAGFFPRRAMTGADGTARFTMVLSPAAPIELLRARFELPEFESGDPERSPLGCHWLVGVQDRAAMRQMTRLLEGQGQIGLPADPD